MRFLKKKKDRFLVRLATQIVDRRNLIFLIYGILSVFFIFSMNWVEVNNSVTAFLPKDSETNLSLELMEEEFITYGTASVMVTNINYDNAEALADELREIDGVTMLTFSDDESSYQNFSALYSITMDYPETDDKCLEILDEIEAHVQDYDYYVSTTLGDALVESVQHEMFIIMILAAIIVVGVLIFTSQTYAEVPVLLITFVSSALAAMGTNFIFGTISFVADSVTVVLQLALSIDYAVIFCNRYKEEHQTLPIREAVIVALSKALPEIFSSSLTTIGGLAAMMFMQFLIGPDLAIALIKAIFFSLLSVFLLMPGLLVVFGKAMDKTKHRSFIPKIPFVGKFAYKTRFIVPPIFLVVLVAAFILSNNCPYVFGFDSLKTPKKNDSQIATAMIEESFGKSNMAALIVPNEGYAKESKLVKELEQYDEIKSIVSLTNTEAMDGYTLTEKIGPRAFSELMDVDYSIAELLYVAYAADDEAYGKIVGGIANYEVPLIDMIEFMYTQIEDGYVTLDEDDREMIDEAIQGIRIARNQLQGENYTRMLLTLNLPEEGDETFGFMDKIHEICAKYYEGEVYIGGESTSQYDLYKTFSRDSMVVTFVSIVAVLIVLLFTFQSAGMPVLLIAVIQGSIWLNFSIPTIMQNNQYFMSNLIVSAIQMGANIDYAIVISGRFLELKDRMPKKEAMIETMNFAFPTIMTSGTMLSVAGILIGNMTSEPSISSMGQCIGRGTIISMILVMFVLPQILLLGEKIIDRTSFKISLPIPGQGDRQEKKEEEEAQKKHEEQA